MEAADRESVLAAEVSAARASTKPLQLTVERLTEEKDLLLKQKAWFEEELENRQDALLKVRRTAAAEIVSVHTQSFLEV